jgi:hypothetical protein
LTVFQSTVERWSTISDAIARRRVERATARPTVDLYRRHGCLEGHTEPSDGPLRAPRPTVDGGCQHHPRGGGCRTTEADPSWDGRASVAARSPGGGACRGHHRRGREALQPVDCEGR